MKTQSKESRLRTWIRSIPIQDPVDRQMASLLQIILIGFMGMILIAGVVNIILSAGTVPPAAILVRTLVFILIIGFPLFLLRRGSFRGSVHVIITFLLALETFASLSVNLRSIAETLTFFTFAILLAGLLVSRKALIITFALSVGIVLLSALRERDAALRLDGVAIAGNFILLNGLMSLFLDRFGIALRAALGAALQREKELSDEMNVRRQTQATLQHFTERLETLHQIDRALLAAQSLHDIAKSALSRIREIIPCPRASVTLFDLKRHQASFLAADFDGMEMIPDTPIPLEEYGLNVVETLRQNKPWSTEDMLADPQVTVLDKRLADEHGIHAWLSLPLLHQGQLIGALNLGRGRGGSFTPEDAEIAHDIANQLAIALQQHRLHNALQDQLIEHANLIAQLEASNAELERFTYTVSHDLRNPLVTIKGFLGMLEKDILDNRPDRIQRDFQRIAGAADKMDALLSELLELSRIGRIIHSAEEVDLVQLTREAIESLDARLRTQNVTVHISSDLPRVRGDRIRLREVLENLLDNAAKYSLGRDHSVVEVGSRQQAGETVIYIKDYGMGIEPQYHTRIFNLFEKLDPTSEGTGIGLALVKRIVEVHGGRIWVESEGAGTGSMFCFTIPDRPPQA